MAKRPKLTEGQLVTMLKRAVHPGEILRDELEERGVSPPSFARQIDVPANRISHILSGKRAVTGDSALRFGHRFGMDPQFWLNQKEQYEQALAEQTYVLCPLRQATSRVRRWSHSGVGDAPGLAMVLWASRMRIGTAAVIAVGPVSTTPYGSGNPP